jgi:hypothetical protein
MELSEQLLATAFGGGGVTVWGYFSFDCKLDLYVLDGNLTGQKYRDNVLAPRVAPHFDNRALADRPMIMDDNARPHGARNIKNVQVQLTFKGKTTPDSYTPTPKSSCVQNMVVLK